MLDHDGNRKSHSRRRAKKKRSKKKRSSSAIGIIGVIVALTIFGFAIYKINEHKKDKEDRKSEQSFLATIAEKINGFIKDIEAALKLN